MSCATPPRGLARHHQWAETCISCVGDTVVAVWRGPSTLEAMQILGEVLTEAIDDTPDGITFLSVVDRTSSAPAREARELMRHLTRTLGPRVNAAAWAVETTALLGLVVPIANASLLLSRTPIDARFFLAVASAAEWLAQRTTRATAGEIFAHVERMRRLLRQHPHALTR